MQTGPVMDAKSDLLVTENDMVMALNVSFQYSHLRTLSIPTPVTINLNCSLVDIYFCQQDAL